jgi:hypothetical protein
VFTVETKDTTGFFFLIGKQRNFVKSIKAPLSIQEVSKKDTKTEKKEERGKTEPVKPKNRRKPKHPNKNQPTKPGEQYITARALLPCPN